MPQASEEVVCSIPETAGKAGLAVTTIYLAPAYRIRAVENTPIGRGCGDYKAIGAADHAVYGA